MPALVRPTLTQAFPSDGCLFGCVRAHTNASVCAHTHTHLQEVCEGSVQDGSLYDSVSPPPSPQHPWNHYLLKATYEVLAWELKPRQLRQTIIPHLSYNILGISSGDEVK